MTDYEKILNLQKKNPEERLELIEAKLWAMSALLDGAYNIQGIRPQIIPLGLAETRDEVFELLKTITTNMQESHKDSTNQKN